MPASEAPHNSETLRNLQRRMCVFALKKEKVMRNRAVRFTLFDLGAGIVAIVVVLGSCFASTRISFDFRAIFAISGVAFFLAGLARGSTPAILAWQSLRVSSGGLLGVAALILNNGFHRLSFPASLLVAGVLCSAAGIVTRRAWPNNRIRSLEITMGVFLLVAICALAAVPNLPAFSSIDAREQPATAFSLSVDRHTVISSDLRGHVTVLAFYASWCAACFQELPHVQTVYQQFRKDPRVAFYAVDTGWNDETAELGKASLLRHHLDVPMAFDSGATAQALKVDALPSLVLLDSEGKVRFAHEGFDTSENLETGLSRHIYDLLKSD
jgi:peroxiredoxin